MTSLLLTLLLCSAGSLLTDLLLGRFDLLFTYLLRPGFLKSTFFFTDPVPPPDKLAIGILAWVIVFYVPILLSVISSPPLHNIMVLLKEIYRLRKVG